VKTRPVLFDASLNAVLTSRKHPKLFVDKRELGIVHRAIKRFRVGHSEHPMKLFQISITVFALAGTSPSFAKVEQCRFIDSKPDREACYDRQAKALAAKKAEAEAKPKTVDSLERMKAEDEMLSRQLKSICRGC